jgi:hypothetical protein
MLAATSPSVGVNCSVAILIAVEDAVSYVIIFLHVKLLFQLMVGSAAKGSSMQSYSH